MRSRTLAAALVLTALYLAIVLYVLAFETKCETALDGGVLECLTFDDFGNLLSGAFAPVAFLWLVVTALLQSRELALQRQELSLSRDVFREQAAALVENASLLKKQNEIFELDGKRADREQADENFDELVQNFKFFCERRGQGHEIVVRVSNSEVLRDVVISQEMLESPKKLCWGMIEAIEEAKSKVEGVTDYEIEFQDSLARDLKARIEGISRMQDKLSAPHQAKFAGLRITRLLDQATWLVKETERSARISP
jgi:hypothetical protein